MDINIFIIDFQEDNGLINLTSRGKKASIVQ